MRYEFTGETRVNIYGYTVRQIRRIRDGVVGGWIDSEQRLDQVSGNAWVSGNAEVFGNAWVSGNAKVFGNAWVFGNAEVSGNAKVFGNAKVSSPFDFLHISGLKYSVNILNSGIMSIGCQTKTFSEWKGLKFQDQHEMNQETFDKTRSVLLPMIDLMELWIQQKPAETKEVD